MTAREDGTAEAGTVQEVTATNRRGKNAAAGTRIDPKPVRQRAWEHGHEVNARGSLPASVRDAYQASNPS